MTPQGETSKTTVAVLTGGGSGAAAGSAARATTGGSISRAGPVLLATADRAGFLAGALLARSFGCGADAAFFGSGSNAVFVADAAFVGCDSGAAVVGCGADAAAVGSGSDAAVFDSGSDAERRGGSGVAGSNVIAVATFSLRVALAASLESADCRHCHRKTLPAAARMRTVRA